MASADDPFDRRHLADPYPFYADLRARSEDLLAVPERGVLLAARHEVARSVLRDHTTFRSGLGVQWVPVAEAGLRATFIENDPPAHTRVRRAVQRWCTPTAMAAMADVVDRIVEEYVDCIVAAGGGDVMEMLARRVPLRVMSEWLGLELPDAAAMWADASFRLGAPDPPAGSEERFAGFLEWAFGAGLDNLRAGGFAEAILAGGDNSRLQDDEPSSRSRRSSSPGSIPPCTSSAMVSRHWPPTPISSTRSSRTWRSGEILRFDAPVRFFLRRTDDGRTVVVLYGSANRDERVFDEPDLFRIDRDASAQLAFGSGIHLCLGAPLARIEGASVFRALAERVSSIEVLNGAERTDSAAIRGFATLPVKLGAR